MRRKRGLTFFELMVVVLVLGLLIVVLMPNLSIVHHAARITRCMSNLRSLGGAVFTYEAASPVAPKGTVAERWMTDQSPAFADGVEKYLPAGRGVFYCPVSVSQDAGKLWRPAADLSVWGYVWLNDRGPDSINMPAVFPARAVPMGYIGKTSGVKNPSERELALDQIVSDADIGPAIRFTSIARPGMPDFSTSHPMAGPMAGQPYDANILFADNHVERRMFQQATAVAIKQGGATPAYLWIPAP